MIDHSLARRKQWAHRPLAAAGELERPLVEGDGGRTMRNAQQCHTCSEPIHTPKANRSDCAVASIVSAPSALPTCCNPARNVATHPSRAPWCSTWPPSPRPSPTWPRPAPQAPADETFAATSHAAEYPTVPEYAPPPTPGAHAPVDPIAESTTAPIGVALLRDETAGGLRLRCAV